MIGSLANQLNNKLALSFRGSSVLGRSYPVSGYKFFTPADLFNNGEQGVWYDPSDLTTMFEDSTGYTAVHAPGNGTADSPVGLLMDKSKNGVGANGAARYNLLAYSQDFTNGVWTSLNLTITASATTAPDGTVTGQLITPAIGNVFHRIQSSSVSVTGGIGRYVLHVKTNGYSKIGITCAGTSYYATFNFSNNSVIDYSSTNVSNVSIVSVGNGWSRIACTIDAGTTQAISIYPLPDSYTSGTPNFAWTADGTSGIYIWGADLRLTSQAALTPTYQKITSDWYSTMAGNHATQTTSTARPTLSAKYNLLVGTDTLATQNVTTVATTYTLAFSGNGTITLSGTKTGTYSSGSNSLSGVTAGTLTLTVTGTVTNADLRVTNDGVGLPAYQRVVDANTYDTTGFPYYLKFDGVDDSLSTPFAFTMTTAANLSEYIVYTPTTSSPSVYTRIFEKGSNTSFGLHNVTSDVEWFFPSAIKVPYNPAVTFTGSLYTRLLLSLRVNPGSNPSVSGVAKGSGFNSTASGTLAISAGTSTDSFYISQYGGGGYYGKQNIYQIVVCGNKISDSQDASMLSYLNSRFFVY